MAKIVACDICTEEAHGDPRTAQLARWTYTVYKTDVTAGKPTNPRTPSKVIDACNMHHGLANSLAITHAKALGTPASLGGSIGSGAAFDHIDVRGHHEGGVRNLV